MIGCGQRTSRVARGSHERFSGFPPEAFAKGDSRPDPFFYRQPRLVTHIDDDAIAAVTTLYRDVVPAGGTVLDQISSWVSHLPEDRTFAEVIGHGLNAAELATNPRLIQRFVQDLNAAPHLLLDRASVDAALMFVSIQYLQKPIDVLFEVARVLRLGAPVVISFSNRCFPKEAVAIWNALDGAGCAHLVDCYLQEASFARTEVRAVIPERGFSDPLTVVIGWTSAA